MNHKKVNSQTIFDECLERQILMIQFFTNINEFMCARHGYKRDQCIPFVNKVDAKCSKFRLTLSFYPDNSAAITAIRFRDKRRGHCTALVNFIDSTSETCHIPYIRFISVLTEEMTEFLLKNNFLNETQRYCPVEGRYVDSKDWHRLTPFGKKQYSFGTQEKTAMKLETSER